MVKLLTNGGRMWAWIWLAACSTGGESEEDSDAPVSDTLTLQSCETEVSTSLPSVFAWFHCAQLSKEGDDLVVESTGLPPHLSFYYPEDHPNHIAWDSRGSLYSPNPNEIAEQSISFRIPLSPVPKGLTVTDEMVDGTVGTDDEEYPMGSVGLALDGVALFNPLAAPNDDIEDEQWTFDPYNAHPAPDGAYHYHTTSPGPLEVLVELGLSDSSTPGDGSVELYGIFCDGTVVLGCTELNGDAPDDAAFDAQNGHLHDLTNEQGDVLLENRYHTHLCPSLFPDHPYTPEIAYYENDCP